MNDVTVFQPPRLPYHPAIEERYNIDKSGWKALTEAIYPTAKSVDSVIMALSYCKARGLDPFKRPVHIVPMWDASKGREVETVWPGISELRTTAFRTKQYAGCDEAEFGGEIVEEFSGRVGRRGYEKDVKVTVAYPEWCRMTVYRDMNGRTFKFVGPKVYWREAYATLGGSDVPNNMWQSRPIGQLEKCAEAAALRKAFPEEIGNQLTSEEMEGRHIASDPADAPPPPQRIAPGAALDAFAAMGNGNGGAAIEHQPETTAMTPYDVGRQARRDGQGFRNTPYDGHDEEDVAEFRRGWQDEDKQQHTGEVVDKAAPEKPDVPETPHDPETGEIKDAEPVPAWLEEMDGHMSACRDQAALDTLWFDWRRGDEMTAASPASKRAAEKIYRTHSTRLAL